jgi:short-subunit dehydrogenase
MNIIVTGASQGIGYELVRELSRNRENRILAIARNQSALKELQNVCRKQSGNAVIIKSIDISSTNFVDIIPQVLDKEMNRVDAVVNNAGSLVNKPFQELEAEDFDRMFSVNVKAVFLFVKMLLPYLNKPSHIVNIGSMGGVQGSAKFPGLSLYSSSKGALAILTESMAEEFKELNIRVNCLALGSAQTEMLSRAFPDFKAPLTAVDMAMFIAYFTLHGHKYFNGKVLPVAVTTP